MKILHTLNGWFLAFGDDASPVSLWDEGGRIGTFFPTRDALQYALRLCGITLS